MRVHVKRHFVLTDGVRPDDPREEEKPSCEQGEDGERDVEKNVAAAVRNDGLICSARLEATANGYLLVDCDVEPVSALYGVHHGRSGRLPSPPCESSFTVKTWCS